MIGLINEGILPEFSPKNCSNSEIVATQKKSQETIQQTANRFGVSYSFVKMLLKRYQAKGSVEPKPHGGGAISKLGVAESVMIFKQMFTKKIEFQVSDSSDFIMESATPKINK